MLITYKRETGTLRWHFPRKHRAKHIFPGAGYYYRGYRCFGTRREILLQPASINHFYSGAPQCSALYFMHIYFGAFKIV